jgi:hypothetical protein
MDVDLFTAIEYRSADTLHRPMNSLVLKRLCSLLSGIRRIVRGTSHLFASNRSRSTGSESE